MNASGSKTDRPIPNDHWVRFFLREVAAGRQAASRFWEEVRCTARQKHVIADLVNGLFAEDSRVRKTAAELMVGLSGEGPGGGFTGLEPKYMGIDEATLNTLTRALRSKERFVRHAAAAALKEFDFEPELLASPLTLMLKREQDLDIQVAIGEVLFKIAPELLFRGLFAADPDYRAAAIRFLAGDVAADAKATLKTFFADCNDCVRFAAKVVHRLMTHGPTETFRFLIESIAKSEYSIRITAFRILRLTMPEYAPLMRAFEELEHTPGFLAETSDHEAC